MLWVITGYSSKMDGFLYLVEAPDWGKALDKVSNLFDGPCTWHEVICDGRTHVFFTNRETTPEEMIEYYECEGSPGWFWEAYAQIAVKNELLEEAVCW